MDVVENRDGLLILQPVFGGPSTSRDEGMLGRRQDRAVEASRLDETVVAAEVFDGTTMWTRKRVASRKLAGFVACRLSANQVE